MTKRTDPNPPPGPPPPVELLDLAAEPPKPNEPVLPTLNPDGSRRWIKARLSPGRYLNARRIVGWALIALFALLPMVKIGGKPAMLLDLPRREFTFFGVTFASTDTVLLMLLLLISFVSVFLISALVGRAWCGWACPQTVYLELMFRPIDRLKVPTFVRWILYGAAAIFVANVFLAYFVGVDTLSGWVMASPLKHPGPFLFVLFVSGLMLFDFAYFREQMCTVICPYARLQSVLLDQRSLVVAYDSNRGEPRGKAKQPKEAPKVGDCVDCGACVRTCPTGIDIRQGLQLECVACTQCIDACDAIMDRLHRPRGLIRYTSEAALLSPGTKPKLLRPRVVIYPLVLTALSAVFLVLLSQHDRLSVQLLRGIGAPYTLDASGGVTNMIRLRLRNPGPKAQSAQVVLVDAPEVRLIIPENPVQVAPKEAKTVGLFLQAPADSFGAEGKRQVWIEVRSEGEEPSRSRQILLGPRAEAP